MATPSNDPRGPEAPLNPALKREIDTSHGTHFEGTDPMKSVSVQDPNEGRSWPWIWAVVGLICLAVAVYILLF